MKREFINQLILIERDRAEKLHPKWPEDVIHAVTIIAEEAGELLQACLDIVYFNGDAQKIREEAVSVGAMVERFLLNFPEHYPALKRTPWDPKFKRKD